MAPPSPSLPSDPLPLDKASRPAGAFVLPANPASVALARRNVRALLCAWQLRDDVCDDALLVVSELVTNAVRYSGGDEIVCTLGYSAQRLRIEVEDQVKGCSRPTRMCPSAEDQSGRGLLLVGGVSTGWGVRETAGGTGRVVWADLPTEADEPGGTAAELFAAAADCFAAESEPHGSGPRARETEPPSPSPLSQVEPVAEPSAARPLPSAPVWPEAGRGSRAGGANQTPGGQIPSPREARAASPVEFPLKTAYASAGGRGHPPAEGAVSHAHR